MRESRGMWYISEGEEGVCGIGEEGVCVYFVLPYE